jgi:hypothetical protein
LKGEYKFTKFAGRKRNGRDAKRRDTPDKENRLPIGIAAIDMWHLQKQLAQGECTGATVGEIGMVSKGSACRVTFTSEEGICNACGTYDFTNTINGKVVEGIVNNFIV